MGDATMLHFLMIVLFCLLPQAKSYVCNEDNFVWTGQQAIDDCDILRPEMAVHWERLTNLPNCLKRVRVIIHLTETEVFSYYLDTPGNKTFEQITNFLRESDRCKQTNVSISTTVRRPPSGTFWGRFKRMEFS